MERSDPRRDSPEPMCRRSLAVAIKKHERMNELSIVLIYQHQKSKESETGSRVVSILGFRMLSVGGDKGVSVVIPHPRRSSIVRCFQS